MKEIENHWRKNNMFNFLIINSSPMQISKLRIVSAAFVFCAVLLSFGTAVSNAQEINSNPTPIDAGIWFVIQNKSQVDTDYDIPAKRMALRVKDQVKVEMAEIPLTGNYDEFLWRTVELAPGAKRYKLVNKKLGMSKALDCCNPDWMIGNLGDYSGQQWVFSNENKSTMGTNAYLMSNELIGDTKAMSLKGNQIVVAGKNRFDKKQAWLFQPMELVSGMKIP